MAALATVMMACGGSGSDNASGTESTACVEGSAADGSQTCAAAKNLDTAAKNAEDNSCSAGSGTVASACPTTGLDGCCTFTNTSNKIKLETCYYQNGAASEMSACTQGNGTWSTTP